MGASTAARIAQRPGAVGVDHVLFLAVAGAFTLATIERNVVDLIGTNGSETSTTVRQQST